MRPAFLDRARIQSVTPLEAPCANGHLLYGILAPQNDFVARDQLVEAMNACGLAENRPLGEILRDRGLSTGRPHLNSSRQMEK